MAHQLVSGGSAAWSPVRQSRRAAQASPEPSPAADPAVGLSLAEAAPRLGHPLPELAIVVPTLNEVGNIRPLLDRITTALPNLSWEVIFVDDDSSDGTSSLIFDLARERPNVRGIRRIGRRGLSSACIEGMLTTGAPYIAVMDADLQHDERLLGQMLSTLKHDHLDAVVASRFAEGSQLDDFSSARERLSHWGNWLGRLVSRANLSDPMSGYFIIRRELLDDVVYSLTGQGFKILLDILASAPRPIRIAEVPMHFRNRHSGVSKLDSLVMLEFAILLADKTVGRYLPVRFVLFALVGLSGVVIHLAVLALVHKALAIDFYWAQAIATVTAMTSNFLLNNQFTYRDRRLSGWRAVKGLLSFYLACSIGAIANIQVAEFVFLLGAPWVLAGFLGAIVGSVWNYGVTKISTWRHQN